MWQFFTKKNGRKASASRNKHGSWWQRKVVAVSGLLVALLGFTWHKVKDPNLLPINAVKIVGEYHQLDRQQLQQTIMPYVAEGFFQVDVALIKQQLEQLPWVEQAVIKKTWPDTVVVQITERQAASRWNAQGVISSREHLFYPATDVVINHLPNLHGPEGTHRLVYMEYQQMQKILHPLGVTITQVTLDKRHAWSLDLDNGMHILLGRDDHQDRLQRFKKAYQEVFGSRSRDVTNVDLRYQHGMAVKWRQSQQLL